MINYANIFESLMLITFGLAWPVNILNTLRVKSSRGRTPVFLFIVNVGYACGIAAKIVGHNVNYVVIFYLINMAMVSFDTFLYFRYRALDKFKYGKG
jgi:hypothetical protein